MKVSWTTLKQTGPKVTFENRGRRVLVVLPQFIHIEVLGPGVEFVPFPGPAIPPWNGAFALLANGSKEAERRYDGVWRTAPGRYRGRAQYVVTQKDVASSAEYLPAGDPWIGSLVLPDEPFELR